MHYDDFTASTTRSYLTLMGLVYIIEIRFVYVVQSYNQGHIFAEKKIEGLESTDNGTQPMVDCV